MATTTTKKPLRAWLIELADWLDGCERVRVPGETAPIVMMTDIGARALAENVRKYAKELPDDEPTE